jgi:hypothetical protein
MSILTGLVPAQSAAYLRTLPSIRERCSRVHELAKQGRLEYFDYTPEEEEQVVKFCLGIIQVSLEIAQCPFAVLTIV